MSMGWRAIACSTSSGTGVGPGDCSKRRPGILGLDGLAGMMDWAAAQQGAER